MTSNPETALQTACDLLQPWTVISTKPDPLRVDIILSRTNLLAAVGALVNARWGFLSAITGLDHPGTSMTVDEQKEWERLSSVYVQGIGISETSWLEVLYHFCHGAAIRHPSRQAVLSQSIPAQHLQPDSIRGIIRARIK